MHPLLPHNDPSLSYVFPGVRQDEHGRQYRSAVTVSNEQVMVDAADPRTFELSGGSFGDNTLHVVVTDLDGAKRRAGAGYTV